MAVHSVIVGSGFSEDVSHRPSPNLWSLFPASLVAEQPGRYGLDVFFPNGNVPSFASGVSQLGWRTYQDTGVTIGPVAGQSGVLRFASLSTDNHCGTITTSAGIGDLADIGGSDAKDVWFEVMLRKTSVLNDRLAFFAGLFDTGATAGTSTVLANNTGNLPDRDYIGFHVNHANGKTVQFVYRKQGQAAQVPISNLCEMENQTWVKLGFLYSTLMERSDRLTVYVNNVRHPTSVNSQAIEEVTFPKGVPLCPTISVKAGSDSLTDTLEVRFIRLGTFKR